MDVGIRCADHVTPLYPQKLALISPTGGRRSVGIVRSRIKATELNVGLHYLYWLSDVINVKCGKCRKRGDLAPRILNLGSTRKLVVSLTSWLPYALGTCSRLKRGKFIMSTY